MSREGAAHAKPVPGSRIAARLAGRFATGLLALAAIATPASAFAAERAAGQPGPAAVARTQDLTQAREQHRPQDERSAAGRRERPRVGLVLGGGGARGIAHLGVLRVLEELRVPIDCIAGTSMGALVGGAYAAGVPVDEMQARIGRIDWDALFSDDPPRTEKPFRAKRDDYENLFRFELGQRGTELLLAPGSTAGYKFEFLLRELVARAGNFADADFDALPIPFRALATDIERGTMQVFERGDLVKAMRASMSVPGLIAPIEIDGVLYVDGGLLQNVPVAAAREACADVVIAVDVGSGLLSRERLDSALGISLQMVNVLMAQNVRASIASLGTGDVLISPELGDYPSIDFAGAMALVPLGESAARRHADALRALAVSEDDYRAWRLEVAARTPAVPLVGEVRVATGGRVDARAIERELAEVPGVDLRRRPETDFSLENLHRRLEQVYGRGDFERMDYRIIDRQGTRKVEVQGIEKSWGPNYLKFGLGLASDRTQARFNASLSHRMTWLNRLGAEWRNDLQLGYRMRLTSELHQPLSLRAGAFIAPRLDAREEPITYYLNDRRVGDYRVSHARLHLDLGLQNKYGEVRFGPFLGRLWADEDFGFLPAPEYDLRQVGYVASATFDQIDTPEFGRNGLLATLRSFGTVERWGSEDAYNRTELLLMGARRFGKHALQLAAYFGRTLSGDLPIYDPYRLGGFLHGSGFRMDELVGDRVDLLRAVYSYRIAALPAPLGRGLYVGASLEATRAVLGADTDAADAVRRSMSVFLGADTFLGPAYVAWGQALGRDGKGTLYLLLGRP